MGYNIMRVAVAPIEGGRHLTMLEASQFQLASVQVAIFTPDVNAFSQPKILADFITWYGARYNGPVTALPLPDDAPPQLPRVSLQSADAVWKLNVAPQRIDSYWAPPRIEARPDDSIAVVTQCSEVLEQYVRSNSVRVGRLALVLQRAYVIPNPAHALIERFCNEESKRAPFNNSESFEIHNHKRYRPSGIVQQINSWVRCRTALIQGEPGIAVEQDLNTLEEESDRSTFDADAIQRFFSHAQPEADSILRLYFPEES